MNRTDRHRWGAARTLADLGELVAQWLEGRIDSYPGYLGPPDTETLPLVPVLARLNRAGYLTAGSQPGRPPTRGLDGGIWQQRAAVDGFCDDHTLTQLTWATAGTDLLLICHRTEARPWWRRWLPDWPFSGRDDGAVPVTATTEARVHTAFGGRIPDSYLPVMWDGACPPTRAA